MTQIKIDVPAMEINTFAKLILRGVESPKDLLDSLVFWGLHFLENAPEGVKSAQLFSDLTEAVSQMEYTLKPLAGFHDAEFNCVMKMFATEMSHHILQK